MARWNRKDWAGQKYGKLTFVRPTDQKRWNCIIWEALCDCGQITTVVPFDATTGNITSCGCVGRETAIKNGLSARQHLPHITSARAIWRSRYKDGDINFETFYQLSQENCYYCGRLPSRSYNRIEKDTSDVQKELGTFTYNGLDRIDSNRGHTLDNVVPCCATCNLMKGKLPHHEFLSHVMRIHDNKLHITKDVVMPAAIGNRRYHPIVSSARHVWKGAYDDGLDFDTFYNLSQQDCYYCGIGPSNSYKISRDRRISQYQMDNGIFIYNGLDRVDSSKGHTPDNVVPCCWDCNRMKGTLSLSDFISHIEMIAQHIMG